jgi:hypothetical protein
MQKDIDRDVTDSLAELLDAALEILLIVGKTV